MTSISRGNPGRCWAGPASRSTVFQSFDLQYPHFWFSQCFLVMLNIHWFQIWVFHTGTRLRALFSSRYYSSTRNNFLHQHFYWETVMPHDLWSDHQGGRILHCESSFSSYFIASTSNSNAQVPIWPCLWLLHSLLEFINLTKINVWSFQPPSYTPRSSI